MNKEKYILLGILAVVLILAFYVVFNFFIKNEEINEDQKFKTLIDNQNNVEFQVTPSKPNEFQITMDTHSVELSFDLMQISTLYDDSENSYKPLAWEGSAPSGHHRSGILKFPEIDENAKSVKLIIIDSAEREFNWNLR